MSERLIVPDTNMIIDLFASRGSASLAIGDTLS